MKTQCACFMVSSFVSATTTGALRGLAVYSGAMWYQIAFILGYVAQGFWPLSTSNPWTVSSIILTGCEFSGEPKLLPFALVEAQSERRVRCPQKNAWHAGAARTTKCA